MIGGIGDGGLWVVGVYELSGGDDFFVAVWVSDEPDIMGVIGLDVVLDKSSVCVAELSVDVRVEEVSEGLWGRGGYAGESVVGCGVGGGLGWQGVAVVDMSWRTVLYGIQILLFSWGMVMPMRRT